MQKCLQKTPSTVSFVHEHTTMTQASIQSWTDQSSVQYIPQGGTHRIHDRGRRSFILWTQKKHQPEILRQKNSLLKYLNTDLFNQTDFKT